MSLLEASTTCHLEPERNVNRARARRAPASGLALVRLAAFFAATLVAVAALALPQRTGWVTDASGSLTPEQRAALDAELTTFERETGFEVAAVVVPSLEGKSIEDASYELAKAWGVGKAGKDNGVVLLVALAERKTRIETGKGVGHLLTDLESNGILERELRPRLRANDLAGGLTAATRAIRGELTPGAVHRGQGANLSWWVESSGCLVFPALLGVIFLALVVTTSSEKNKRRRMAFDSVLFTVLSGANPFEACGASSLHKEARSCWNWPPFERHVHLESDTKLDFLVLFWAARLRDGRFSLRKRTMRGLQGALATRAHERIDKLAAEIEGAQRLCAELSAEFPGDPVSPPTRKAVDDLVAQVANIEARPTYDELAKCEGPLVPALEVRAARWSCVAEGISALDSLLQPLRDPQALRAGIAKRATERSAVVQAGCDALAVLEDLVAPRSRFFQRDVLEAYDEARLGFELATARLGAPAAEIRPHVDRLRGLRAKAESRARAIDNAVGLRFGWLARVRALSSRLITALEAREAFQKRHPTESVGVDPSPEVRAVENQAAKLEALPPPEDARGLDDFLQLENRLSELCAQAERKVDAVMGLAALRSEDMAKAQLLVRECRDGIVRCKAVVKGGSEPASFARATEHMRDGEAQLALGDAGSVWRALELLRSARAELEKTLVGLSGRTPSTPAHDGGGWGSPSGSSSSSSSYDSSSSSSSHDSSSSSSSYDSSSSSSSYDSGSSGGSYDSGSSSGGGDYGGGGSSSDW